MTLRRFRKIVASTLTKRRDFIKSRKPIGICRTVAFIIDARNGKVVADGFAHHDNRICYASRSSNRWRVVHAETHVLRQVDPRKLGHAILYVYAENKKGRRHLARPCPDCLKALRKTNLKGVAYSCKSPGPLVEFDIDF